MSPNGPRRILERRPPVVRRVESADLINSLRSGAFLMTAGTCVPPRRPAVKEKYARERAVKILLESHVVSRCRTRFRLSTSSTVKLCRNFRATVWIYEGATSFSPRDHMLRKTVRNRRLIIDSVFAPAGNRVLATTLADVFTLKPDTRGLFNQRADVIRKMYSTSRKRIDPVLPPFQIAIFLFMILETRFCARGRPPSLRKPKTRSCRDRQCLDSALSRRVDVVAVVDQHATRL